MQKFILFFTLLILSVVMAVFLLNSYLIQRSYFNMESNPSSVENIVKNEEPVVYSVYKNYAKADYDQAIASNREIVLFFTSNWCTECKSQELVNNNAFNNINNQGVLGLIIHILDSETTTETDALAKKFDVTKENTFVFLNKSGAVGLKHVGVLTSEQLVANILKVGDNR